MSIIPGIPLVCIDPSASQSQSSLSSTSSSSASVPPVLDFTNDVRLKVREADVHAPSIDLEDFFSTHPSPPIVPSLCPYRVNLTPGKNYLYCTCGRSEDQPFCDDSHHDDDPQPIKFSVNNSQSFWSLCGCKYSNSMPWCDGSHVHVRKGTEEYSDDDDEKVIQCNEPSNQLESGVVIHRVSKE